MRKNSLTLLLTLGGLIIMKQIFTFDGEILSKYQSALLFMLTYLSLCKVLE